MHGERSGAGDPASSAGSDWRSQFASTSGYGAEPLRWLSAFRYYGAPMVEGFDPVTFAGLTVAGVLLARVGAVLFERRDVLAH